LTAWPEATGQCGKCFARYVAGQLNDRAETLAGLLLPGGVRAGKFWRSSGATLGAAGDSHMLQLNGPKRGSWANYLLDESDPAGKGDMLKLVQLTVGNGSFGEAMRWAAGWLGISGAIDPAALARQRDRARLAEAKRERALADETERKRLSAQAMWLHATPFSGTPAQRYLEGRGIAFAAIGRMPRALRFRADVWHDETRRKLPAMLTAYFGLDGEHRATHATYLTRLPDGSWDKLPPVETVNPRTGEVKLAKCAKKTFSPSYKGAHIPLNKGTCRAPLGQIAPGTPVYVSEGIEDGLTVAMADPARRVVAAGTLGNIGRLELPRQAGDLVIVGQRDAPGSPAERSLEKQLAAQQRAAQADGSGRRVLMLWPGAGFKDFNDELRGVRM
jgi:hypothetical protein